MWYDKKKKKLYDRLPRKHAGVSRFDLLSPSDLHGHGFVEVTDARPAYDHETQRLVKGNFNESTALQHWIVEPIPVIVPGPKYLGQTEIIKLFKDCLGFMEDIDKKIKKKNNNTDIFRETLAEYEQQESPVTSPDNSSAGSLSL